MLLNRAQFLLIILIALVCGCFLAGLLEAISGSQLPDSIAYFLGAISVMFCAACILSFAEEIIHFCPRHARKASNEYLAKVRFRQIMRDIENAANQSTLQGREFGRAIRGPELLDFNDFIPGEEITTNKVEK